MDWIIYEYISIIRYDFDELAKLFLVGKPVKSLENEAISLSSAFFSFLRGE